MLSLGPFWRFFFGTCSKTCKDPEVFLWSKKNVGAKNQLKSFGITWAFNPKLHPYVRKKHEECWSCGFEGNNLQKLGERCLSDSGVSVWSAFSWPSKSIVIHGAKRAFNLYKVQWKTCFTNKKPEARITKNTPQKWGQNASRSDSTDLDQGLIINYIYIYLYRFACLCKYFYTCSLAIIHSTKSFCTTWKLKIKFAQLVANYETPRPSAVRLFDSSNTDTH